MREAWATLAESSSRPLPATLAQSHNLAHASLETAVDSLKKADWSQQEDLLDSVPLGAILPWINKPTQDSLHQEDLPVGFAFIMRWLSDNRGNMGRRTNT